MMIYDLRKDSNSLVEHLLDTSMGLPSGITTLDEMLLGFDPGELIIIAGRPGMGKSSLARDISLSIGEPSVAATTLFYSLEMSCGETSQLLLASLAKANYYGIKRGNITDTIKSQLDNASAQLSTYNIIVDDNSNTNPDYIRTSLREQEETISCIIVDYIQLMSLGRRPNRQEEVSEISRELKSIAKEFNLPVIALSQLNRLVEYRESTRPRLSDLRESGAMEQDAHKVLLLHRPSYNTIKISHDMEDDDGEAEIIIAKNRKGPTGVVKCAWAAEWMSFRDIPEEF